MNLFHLSKDDYSAKAYLHNTLLQIFTVLHYFGEFIAVAMRQDMVDETVDSILVKEGRIEITFLFHSNCLISQYCFYKENHDSIHIKIYMIFFLCFAFFHEKKKKKSAST